MIHRKSEIEHRKSEIDLAIGSPEVEAGVEGEDRETGRQGDRETRRLADKETGVESRENHNRPIGKRLGYLLKSFCTQ